MRRILSVCLFLMFVLLVFVAQSLSQQEGGGASFTDIDTDYGAQTVTSAWQMDALTLGPSPNSVVPFLGFLRLDGSVFDFYFNGSTGLWSTTGGTNGIVLRSSVTGTKPQASSGSSSGNEDGLRVADGIASLVANESEQVVARDDSAALMTCRFFGSLAAAPTPNGACDTYYDTGTESLWTYTGAAWREYQVAAHGELYEKDIDGTPANSISITTGGTYYGWTTASAGITAGGVTLDTADATADEITVADAGGHEITWDISASGSASITAICCAFIDNAAPTINSCKARKFPVGGTDVGSFGNTSKHTLSASAEVDLRCTTLVGQDSKTIDLWTVNLGVARLGG